LSLEDAETNKSRGKAIPDYSKFLDANGLRGARIGVARNFFGYHEKIDQLIISGIPVGISFIGGAFSEPTLVKIAYSFEQATKFRKPPQFQPSDEAR
jgi:hypothetical protein